MQRRHDCGFTLLEMVVALTVFSLISLAGFQVVGSGMDAFNATRNRIDTVDKTGYALPRLTRELREIAYTGTAYDITTMQATNLVFTKADATQVTVGLNGSTLTLAYSTINAGQAYTLTDEVTAFTLNYYKSDGVTTTVSNTDVAFVEIDLTLTHDGTAYAQRTRIAFRN